MTEKGVSVDERLKRGKKGEQQNAAVCQSEAEFDWRVQQHRFNPLTPTRGNPTL